MGTPYKSAEERLTALQATLEHWVEVTMVNYNEKQYGKGAIMTALAVSKAEVPDGWAPKDPAPSTEG
jgi:hypothetical protein